MLGGRLVKMDADRRLAGLAAAALAVGGGLVCQPGLALRALGLPDEAGGRFGLRLVGVRDLTLAWALLRAARGGGTVGERRMAVRLAQAVQVGDLLVARGMRRRGRLSARAAEVVALGAAATLAAAAGAGRPGRR